MLCAYGGETMNKNVKTDPWKDRSKYMLCKTCMWYAPKVLGGGAKDKEWKDGEFRPIGRCRKHAPVMSGYPVVFETDWCGDHKIDENKL